MSSNCDDPTLTDEERLRCLIAEEEARLATEIVTCDANIAACQAAMPTAGDAEYIPQEEAAAAACTQASEDYADYLEGLQSSCTAAAAAFDAVDEPEDQSSKIDEILPISIETGGTPDCSAAQIEAAVNAAISKIIAALDALNQQITNGAIGNLKTGGTEATEGLQLVRSIAASDVDTDALFAAAVAAVDGAY